MRWHDTPGGQQGIRVLVADRQPLVAAALVALLATLGHNVAAAAGQIDEVRARLNGGDFDVALVDIDLDAAGLPATTSLPIIVIAPSADHPDIAAAIDAGCKGLVLKSDTPRGLARGLAAVAAGGQWFDADAVALAHDRRSLAKASALTPRERDVARLVVAGQRNRTIGDALGISEGTVKMHLHNVYAKLGIESRTQLAMDDRVRALG